MKRALQEGTILPAKYKSGRATKMNNNQVLEDHDLQTATLAGSHRGSAPSENSTRMD